MECRAQSLMRQQSTSCAGRRHGRNTSPPCARAPSCSASPGCCAAGARHHALGLHGAVAPLVGATYEKARVVRDGNVFTGGGGVTAASTSRSRSRPRWRAPRRPSASSLSIEYDPAPPFTSGNPDAAPAPVLEHAGGSARSAARDLPWRTAARPRSEGVGGVVGRPRRRPEADPTPAEVRELCWVIADARPNLCVARLRVTIAGCPCGFRRASALSPRRG